MQGYEVFFCDQRGAGWTSPGETRCVTNEFHVFDDLNFFIKKNLEEVNGKTKLILGGHSMGGAIVLNYGIIGKYRDQISAIFATGPCITIHPNNSPVYRYAWTARRSLRKLYRGPKLLNPELASKFNRPVLIIHGEGDEVNDPASSKKFIDLIPVQNKELVLVKNSAHCCLLEVPEVYDKYKTALFNWLKDIPDGVS